MSGTVTKDDFEALERKVAYLQNRILGLSAVTVPLLVKAVGRSSVEDTKDEVERFVELIESTKSNIVKEGILDGRFTDGLFDAADEAVVVLKNYLKFIDSELKKEGDVDES